jgi:hypothetical protein
MKKLIYTLLIAIIILFQIGTALALNLTLGWDSYANKADISGGGFYLKISPTTGGPYVIFDTVNDVDATEYTFYYFETVYPQSRYYFVMTAFRANGVESDNSNEVTWVKPTTTTTSIIPTTTTTVKPTTTTTSVLPTTTTTSVLPTTTTTSIIPTTTTTSIKPVAPVTGLTIITR